MIKQEGNLYMLNKQINTHELFLGLTERLGKVTAMLAIASSEDFLNFDHNHVKNYFWTIEGLIGEVVEISDSIQEQFPTNSVK